LIGEHNISLEMKPYPESSVLSKHVLDLHSKRGADPGEAINHERDVRPSVRCFNSSFLLVSFLSQLLFPFPFSFFFLECLDCLGKLFDADEQLNTRSRHELAVD
jgi:hypothetical protein